MGKTMYKLMAGLAFLTIIFAPAGGVVLVLVDILEELERIGSILREK